MEFVMIAVTTWVLRPTLLLESCGRQNDLKMDPKISVPLVYTLCIIPSP